MSVDEDPSHLTRASLNTEAKQHQIFIKEPRVKQAYDK